MTRTARKGTNVICSILFILLLLPLCGTELAAQGSRVVDEERDSLRFGDEAIDEVPKDQDDELNLVTTPPLGVTGQVRLRTEIDRRSPGPSGNEEARDVHFLRTRLNILMHPAENVSGLIQPQDSRTFGSSGGTIATIDQNAFDIHQAWFELSNFLVDDLAVRVGRQELAYGNERLVGAVGWHNRGRTFDGIRLRGGSKTMRVDLFGARTDNGQGQAPSVDGTSHLFGAWGTFTPNSEQTFDFFVLYDNNNVNRIVGEDSAVDALNRGTYGARFLGSPFGVTLELEGAYQNGDVVLGSGQPLDTARLGSIGAFMASARAGIKSGNLNVALLYTLLSGDDDPTDDKQATFNTLFATNHKFYGFMDYFPQRSGSMGLQDVALLLGLKASKSTNIALDGHYFLPAVEGDPFGMEFDVTLKHHYNQVVGFVLGGSLFLPDDGFAALLGDETGFWGYLMATVNL